MLLREFVNNFYSGLIAQIEKPSKNLIIAIIILLLVLKQQQQKMQIFYQENNKKVINLNVYLAKIKYQFS